MAGLEVQVEGLCKEYNKAGRCLTVLRGVDLHLDKGDRVAIRGRSGSGKSTLLHVLGTLDQPTSGKIRFDGRDVFNRPAGELDALRNREVGFVFQFHHLLPDQDALYNVAMPALISGMSTGDALKRAGALLDRVHLGERTRHRPGELSGGEQQRVAIARALIMSPGLLLADEPTGNLDPRTAEEVLELLLSLNADMGTTLVVVTHSSELAARFPQQLNLVHGRLAESE